MGIYAFNNPDSEAWLGLGPDGNHALYADKTAGDTANATELVDIHARFVFWFLWGFSQALLIPLSSMLLTVIGALIHPTLGTLCAGLTGCTMSCGGLAWWITGIVWRFRSDGAYAVGDIVPEGKTVEDWEAEITTDGSLYQFKSGKFMFIYYIISWSIMACSCLCSIIAAICGCVAKAK